MVETQAISAVATLLQRGNGDGPPETFTTLAEVTNISGPSLSHPNIDATHAESGGYKEFIESKLREVNEFSVDIQYVPTHATHDATTGIIADLVSGAKKNYKLLFPDGTPWIFACRVTNFEPSAPTATEEKLTASVTFRPTGVPTLV